MSDTKTAGHLGKPWSVVGTYPSYEAASAAAKPLASNKALQIKIKCLSSGFTVRSRKLQASSSDISRLDDVVAVHDVPAPKKTKLKAKDRRALERSRSTEDTFDSSSEDNS